MLQHGRTGATPDGGEPQDGAAAAAAVVELIEHTLAAEDRGRSVAGINTTATTIADGSGTSRTEAPVPPWLLMAMVAAARSQGAGGGVSEAAETGGPPIAGGGGDPAKAAPEAGLRSTLERRVAESLRSVQSVRALLQDPAGSARQGGAAAGRAGSASLSAADDEAVGKIDALSAAVDPATALFERTLREWLACRGGGGKEGEGGLYSDGGEVKTDSTSFGGGGRPLPGFGLERGAEGSRFVTDDALALAFRCEAAGDAEAMVSVFLRRGRSSCRPLKKKVLNLCYSPGKVMLQLGCICVVYLER